MFEDILTVHTINAYLNTHSIPTNPRWVHKSADLTNREFGRLIAIRRHAVDKHSKALWWCRCKCGKEKAIAAASLLRGLSASCGCLKVELAHVGYKEISASFWRKKQLEAVRRGYEFSITPEDVWAAYEKQDRKCVYTGVPVVFGHNSNRPQDTTASIDRKDNFTGYTRDNIQIVHKIVNRCRNWLPEDEFIAMCNLVAANWRMDIEDCIRGMARNII